MAYNLYQVQAARAWAERIDKEQAIAEKFWMGQVQAGANPPGRPATSSSPRSSGKQASDTASLAATSVCPSGYSSKTSFLASRLDRLEAELALEKLRREEVEITLAAMRATNGSKPGTPRMLSH